MSNYTRRQFLEIFGCSAALSGIVGHLAENNVIRPDLERKTFERVRKSPDFKNLDDNELREVVRVYHDGLPRKYASTAGGAILAGVVGVGFAASREP